MIMATSLILASILRRIRTLGLALALLACLVCGGMEIGKTNRPCSGCNECTFHTKASDLGYNDSLKGNTYSPTVIPKDLQECMKETLPGYSLPQIDDYLPNWREYSPHVNMPFVSSADFNGDGQMDYALLLLNRRRELFLFVFHKTPNGFRHFVVDDYPIRDKIDIILSVEPKGEWEVLDEVITVPNDAILAEMMEESLSVAYYWDGKKYVKVLSD